MHEWETTSKNYRGISRSDSVQECIWSVVFFYWSSPILPFLLYRGYNDAIDPIVGNTFIILIIFIMCDSDN